jgi:hypothetical protein
MEEAFPKDSKEANGNNRLQGEKHDEGIISPAGNGKKRSMHRRHGAGNSSSPLLTKHPKLLDLLPINLKKANFKKLWKWKVRKENAVCALPSGLKLSALAETCFQWCASYEVHCRMVEKKVLLRTMSILLGSTAESKSKKKRKECERPTISIRVQRDFVGWDHAADRPLKKGAECVTSAIAQKHGIKGNTSNWNTWPVEKDLQNGALFRKREKSRILVLLHQILIIC